MSTQKMADKQEARPSSQELQRQYDTFKQTISQLREQIESIQNQADEHRLVLETLKNTDPTRKCFRMVGGVLVEKTVGDVVPVLTTNLDGLTQVLETRGKDLTAVNETMNQWRTKYNVKVVQA